MPGSLVGVLYDADFRELGVDTAVAGTAIGPMVIAAVDQFDEHPLVRDDFAARILPVAGRVAVAAARWRPMRNLLFTATEKKIPVCGRACCAASGTSTNGWPAPTRARWSCSVPGSTLGAAG